MICGYYFLCSNLIIDREGLNSGFIDMIQSGEIVSIIVVYYTYKKAYEHNPHTLLIFIKTSVILLTA